MWYFIPNHLEKLEQLGERFTVTSMDILQPGIMTGIGFPEHEAEEILKELGLTEPYQKINTEMEGLVYLRFKETEEAAKKATDKELKVTIKSWEGDTDYREHFKRIAQELLPIVKKPIEIYVPHGSRVEPVADDKFRIFLYSSTVKNRKEAIPAPHTVFGINVDNKSSSSFVPYGEPGETSIITDESSLYDVAEIIGDNLFIHYDICHYGSDREARIFKEIINRVIADFQLTPDQRKEKRQKILAELANGRIIVRRWHHSQSQQRRFEEVIKSVLLPQIKKDTFLETLGGSRSNIENDGKFHINIYSSCRNDDQGAIQPPAKIFGLQIDNSNKAYLPSKKYPDSIIIIDDATGYAVAQLIGETLFIHNDLGCISEPSESEIFKRLLSAVVNELKLTPEERAEIKRQKILEKKKQLAEEEQRDREKYAALSVKARPLYIAACANRLKKVISESQTTLKVTDENIGNVSAQHIKHARILKVAEQNCAQLLMQYEQEKKRLADEFDQLTKLPGVAGVAVINKNLLVYTELIKINHEGIVYLIGQFLIKLSLTHEQPLIVITNRSNLGRGPGFSKPDGFNGDENLNRHHPFINSQGQAELGDLLIELPQFLGEHQYSTVVMIILQFLKTVDVKSYAGRGLLWWPKEEVRQPEPIVTSVKKPRNRKRKKEVAA